MSDLTKDWEWFSFLTRYCAGKNISHDFCQDVRWWALGIAVLVVVLVAAWIWGRVARAYGNWSFRRAQARIADPETMKQHVWSGHDVHLTSNDQRANRKPSK